MELIIAVVVWLLLWLAPLCGLMWAGYALISAPLRHRERIRSFLMLLDAGLKEGQRVEDTIVAIGKTRDPGLGRRFQALAISLQSGNIRLSQALESVPGFMPRQITAMLKVGEMLGNYQKVLPACRHLVKDSLALTRSSMNYLLVAAFVTTPVAIAILTVIQIYVLPQFNSVAIGMGISNPSGITFLIENRTELLVFQFLLLLLVWFCVAFYIGSPPLFNWIDRISPTFADWLVCALPWRRRRLQRDFSSMLAILLDGGVPEPEALKLAASCTANRMFIRRAELAAADLGQGMKLSEVISRLDNSGEFRWRFRNASHGHGGFFKAIAGWNESLDAKAFQQEQATAQMVTTGLVLLNGVFVGFIVVSVFSVLIAIVNEGVLW